MEKEKADRHTREDKVKSSSEYAGSVIRNLTLPIKKAVEKGKDAAIMAHNNLDAGEKWAAPVVIPVSAIAGASYGAVLGTAMVAKRAYRTRLTIKS